MSNYTKSTNFATKDNLTPGDPLKVVRGTEIDTEFNNIATAVATKTDNASAAITGGSITGITDLAVADGGTGASTAAGALNNLLPSQTSAANKYLQSDGTNASWDAVTLSTADITGTLPVANGGTGVTSSTGTGSVVLSNSPTLVTPALGTPASGVATNLTGLPISTGVSGLGTGVATFLGTPSSANLASAVTDETGSGALVFANSPTLVTPALGTPSALVGTNITGTASGLTAGNVTTNANLTGAVTSVGNATSLGSFSSANLLGALTDETGTGSAVFATSPTLVTPILGTPTSATLTNATGLPIATGVSGLGTGVATFLATPSSANLAAALTDETGSGANVFATSPTLVTPILGTPTSATLTNATGLPISTGVSGLGTGIATALAVNTGSAGAPVLFNGALGTPSSGTVTNLTGTASININGTVGATTATTGAFTTVSATSTGTFAGVLSRTHAQGTNAYLTVDTFAKANTVMGFNDSGATVGGVPTANSYFGTLQNFQLAFISNNALLKTSSYTIHAWNIATAESMRLNSTGLGIGTSSPQAKLEIAQSADNTDGPKLRIANNGNTLSNGQLIGGIDFFDGDDSGEGVGAYIYSYTTDSIGRALGQDLRFATGGTTEKMRLDSSGNLLLGATSIYTSSFTGITSEGKTSGTGNLSLGLYKTGVPDILNGDVLGNIYFYGVDNDVTAGNNNIGARIASIATTNWTTDGTTSNAALVFYTHGTTSGAPEERARITSTGDFQVGGTASSVKFYVEQSANNLNGYFRSTNASYTNGVLEASADRNTTNSSYNFIQCAVVGVAYRFFVRDSGNVENTNNSYGAISDVKLKENIIDASPKLADLMQVKVRQYNFKNDQTHKQIGVIAQELEQIFPAMIEESPDKDMEGNDLGTTTKSVKYSVFVPMLIKAVQEQQAIIESLKARLDAANL